MRAVVQRVKNASVKVEGEVVGRIEGGHLIFLGIEDNDTLQDMEYLAEKIINLRVFEDNEGKMNLSLMDMGGAALIVSQFTICGDCRKGRRPNFSGAASLETAKDYYEKFCSYIASKGVHVEKGVFQAHMEVELVNDGPVTLLLDSRRNF